jgi:hypothetical protein
VIGGSGYFDGSGDYLTVPDSTQTDLGSGDFTVECWFYQFSLKVTSCVSLDTATGTGYAMGASTTANKTWWYANSAAQILSSATFNYNTWNHLAVARSGGTTTMYLNGASVGSFSDSINYSGTTTYIGSDEFNQFWNGYISGARVVKGTAVYTSAFTPPTAPPTAISNTQLLTNFTNGAIFDSAMTNDGESSGNTQISTSVKKFGTGSLYFDGTGGTFLISPGSSNFNFGTGNFTMEGWFYQTAVISSYPSILGNPQRYSGDGAWAILTSHDTYGVKKLQVYVYNYDTAGPLLLGSTTLADNTWYYFAFTRSGSTFRLFLNGVIEATQTFSGALNAADNSMVVGYNSNLFPFQGYIDEVRVTKGIARYTANFTPPTQAFPNVGPN